MPDQIDTSIYKVAPQGGIGSMNPLQILDLANRTQEFNSQNQINNLLKGSIDPATNQLDTNALRAGVRQGNISRGVLPLLSGAQQYDIGTQEQSIRTTQAQSAMTDYANKRIAQVQDALGTLATKPGANWSDVHDVTTRFAAVPGMDVRTLQGAFAPLRGVKEGTPEFRDALVKAGNMAMGTSGVFPRTQIGIDPNTGQAVTGPAGTANYVGTYAGLPPGSEKSSNLMYGDLANQKNFGREIFPWEQALDAANNLKAKYGGGYFAPGSKGRQEFESFFYGVSPTISRWMGVDEGKIKDYAKADKYLTQGMQTQAANFGVHTDQALATAASGNPNVSVNDLAVEDVIKSNIALRRAEYAQALTASKAGGPNYSQAAADWAGTHDIRAFMLDKLDDNARAKLLGSLKKGTPEWQRFNASLAEAYNYGLLTRPGAAPLQPKPVKTISVTQPSAQ